MPFIIAIATTWAVLGVAADAAPPLAALEESRYAAAIEQLQRHLAQQPRDQAGHFALGIARYGAAVEHFMVGAAKSEVIWNSSGVRPAPAELRKAYENLRKQVRQLARELQLTDRSLARVDSPEMRLRIRIGRLATKRLDADGQPLLESIRMMSLKADPDRHAKLDLADALWMRGQCQLTMGICQFMEAHDWSRLLKLVGLQTYTDRNWTNEIAGLHLVKWRVIHPAAMGAVLRHFQKAVELQLAAQVALEAETDDDEELLVGVGQTSTQSKLRVNAGMLKARRAMFNAVRDVLSGKRLVPLIRDYPTFNRGFNLRRVFTEPTEFDLIRWVEGSAAEPYLEKGDVNQGFWIELFMVVSNLQPGAWHLF